MRSIQGWIAMAMLAVAGQVGAEAPRFSSRVSGIHASALAELPAAPAPDPVDAPPCPASHWRAAGSAAARQVQARGWTVTSELSLPGHTLVGFFARGRAGTSSTCLVRDGNIAVFRGTRLLGVIHGPPTDAHTASPVALVAAGDRAGSARIWSGDYVGLATADLRLGAEAIEVLPLSTAEAVCNGRARLPGVRGQGIDQARRALLAAGWAPKRRAQPIGGDDVLEQDLVKRGIVEIDTCSGSGMMFCGFDYTHAGGIRLSVTTHGEDYTVSEVGVRCGDGR